MAGASPAMTVRDISHVPKSKARRGGRAFRHLASFSSCLPLRFLALGSSEDLLPFAQMLSLLLDGGQLSFPDV